MFAKVIKPIATSEITERGLNLAAKRKKWHSYWHRAVNHMEYKVKGVSFDNFPIKARRMTHEPSAQW